jgi:chlorobactene glucosyltransferase
MTELIISSLLFLGGMLIVHWLHNQWQLDHVARPVAPPHDDSPLISVCIPARNEGRNIRRSVEAVLAQTYPNFELIVLDDRSTDSTPQILEEIAARDARLSVLRGGDLPPGWAGKPHALHQASAVARGDWILFLDADTFLAPEALAASHALSRQTAADLLTLMTYQELGSFWEKVIMPLVFTALSVGFSPRKVNDPTRRDAIANGQYIFIRADVYRAIGGHESVRDKIVEDKALAEKVKWSGCRLVVADGRLAARTRMYTSLPEMWEGWTKNIYLGLQGEPGLALLGVFGAFLAVLAALFLPLWPVLGLLWAQTGGGWMAWTVVAQALTLWGYLLWYRARGARDMGISLLYALTTPLGAGVFAAMMFASAFKVVSGRGVTWKGRRYA